VTPGIARALREARPDVVVVSGWSTYAAQAAMSWARLRRRPYVLLVESHDVGRKTLWRRAVKSAVVPPALRGAANVLAVGTAARTTVVARGIPPERVRIFANTIDVERWSDRSRRLARRRRDGVVLLSVGRLVPEKAFDVLVRASAGTDVAVVIAGDGPERDGLERLARELGVSLTILGDVGEAELAQQYVDADVFVLLSRHEPWGVVVNEAAASGLPLLLSDRVGAAYDLLREGENGFAVRADDVEAAATALRALAADPDLRRRMGERSRGLVGGWDYASSVERFVAAVREAVSR
jgi:glycosyltransferase involved in cell wall biosynthesis